MGQLNLKKEWSFIHKSFSPICLVSSPMFLPLLQRFRPCFIPERWQVWTWRTLSSELVLQLKSFLQCTYTLLLSCNLRDGCDPVCLVLFPRTIRSERLFYLIEMYQSPSDTSQIHSLVYFLKFSHQSLPQN